jgi:hypothetical protein
MWTRTYLALLVVRAYFAISPSYIHPDENFQGPEIAAGKSKHSGILTFSHRFLVSDVPLPKSGGPYRT